MNSPFGPNSSSCAAVGAYAGPLRAVRAREDEDVSLRIDRDARHLAEVRAGRQLEEVGARIEWNVGNALLRDRRRRHEQEQCKYRRFHRVLRAADAIAEQANGIDCGRIREEPHMTADRSFRILLALGLLSAAVAVSCTSPSSTTTSAPAAAAPAVAQEKGGQEEFGPYELVHDWPKPLPDGPDGVKHDGWTWGSVGAVYAETPDRIWIAQRGELPLPQDAKPWTPYAHAAAVARQRDRQHRRPERHLRPDAEARMGAPLAPRGLRRRSQRQDGPVSGRTSTRCSSQDPCGRGPHKIKMNPYDPREARLDHRRPAAPDLQVHLRRQAGDDARHARASADATAASCSTGRPTSPGCPTAPSSSATATAARASRSSTRTASS